MGAVDVEQSLCEERGELGILLEPQPHGFPRGSNAKRSREGVKRGKAEEGRFRGTFTSRLPCVHWDFKDVHLSTCMWGARMRVLMHVCVVCGRELVFLVGKVRRFIFLGALLPSPYRAGSACMCDEAA